MPMPTTHAPPPRRPAARHARGFTLVEAMIVMTVLTIVALGAGVGLQSLARVPDANEDQLAIGNALVDKMEQARGMSVTSLLSATNLSDTVTLAGRTYPRSVTVAAADPTGGSAPEADFVRVTVTMGNRSISCFITSP